VVMRDDVASHPDHVSGSILSGPGSEHYAHRSSRSVTLASMR
jgi:hypothetical protein